MNPQSLVPFANIYNVLQQDTVSRPNRLTRDQLKALMATLTKDLQAELHSLTVCYRDKRQPLLNAIAAKTAPPLSERPATVGDSTAVVTDDQP